MRLFFRSKFLFNPKLGWGYATEPEPELDSTGVGLFFADEHGIDTFGLDLIAGRNFTPGEANWTDGDEDTWPPVAIFTRAMAEEIFPDVPLTDVVGKTRHRSFRRWWTLTHQ